MRGEDPILLHLSYGKLGGITVVSERDEELISIIILYIEFTFSKRCLCIKESSMDSYFFP